MTIFHICNSCLTWSDNGGTSGQCAGCQCPHTLGAAERPALSEAHLASHQTAGTHTALEAGGPGVPVLPPQGDPLLLGVYEEVTGDAGLAVLGLPTLQTVGHS